MGASASGEHARAHGRQDEGDEDRRVQRVPVDAGASEGPRPRGTHRLAQHRDAAGE